jgi:hypothetical protein
MKSDLSKKYGAQALEAGRALQGESFDEIGNPALRVESYGK